VPMFWRSKWARERSASKACTYAHVHKSKAVEDGPEMALISSCSNRVLGM
jgi:hypothetical protein